MTGPWPGNDRADAHRRDPESAVPPPRPDAESASGYPAQGWGQGGPQAPGQWPGGAQGPWPGGEPAPTQWQGGPPSPGQWQGGPPAQGPWPGGPPAPGQWQGGPQAQGQWPGGPQAQGPWQGGPQAQGPWAGQQAQWQGQPGAQGYPAPGTQGYPASGGGRRAGRGGPPGWRRGPWIWLVPAVVVVGVIALVLALTVPGGHGSGGSGSGGSGPAAAGGGGTWQAAQEQGRALTAMTYGRDLIVVADQAVYAYDRTTGKHAWQVTAPASASGPEVFCGASQSAPGGMLSVGIGTVHGAGDVACSSVGLVDLASGRLAWVRPLPAPGDNKDFLGTFTGIYTEVSGTTVLAGWGGVVSAFSVAGKSLWTDTTGGIVSDMTVSGGDLYVAQIYEDDDVKPVVVNGLNPANGDVTSELDLSSRTAPVGSENDATFVSASPLVMLVTNENGDADANVASLLVLDATGNHVMKVIPAGAQNPAARPQILDAASPGDNDDAHGYVRTLVSGGKVFALTATGGRAAQGLAAIDLGTGARAWTATPKGLTMVQPVAVTGTSVIAAALSIATHDPVLVRLSLASGRVQSVTDRKTGSIPLSDSFQNFYVVWADGRGYAADLGIKLAPSQPEVFALSAAG